MSAAVPTLHVAFSLSAATHLGTALRQLGRNDEVAALTDDLSFGPINPPDPALRARWVEEELGCEEGRDIVGDVGAFWAAALSPRERRIAWMSRRSAEEYAGFLEFMWRLGDAPCDIVDVTDLMIVLPNPFGKAGRLMRAGSVALIPAIRFVELGLVDSARPLTGEMRARHREQWRRLRNENAPLRVLRPDLTLVSAPISHFDELLLSSADRRWRKSAYVVGRALTRFHDEDLYQTGDMLLAARLRVLVENGRLDAVGDVSRLRFSEVRLPAASSGPTEVVS